MQLRSKIKDSHPGQWDISAAGHVDSGETPLKGALREIWEEIGIKPSSNELKLIEVRKISKYQPEIGWQNNEFSYIYLYQFDEDVTKLKIQEEEVEKMKFMSLKKFEKEISNPETYKKYVPHGEHYNKTIKAIREELSKI